MGIIFTKNFPMKLIYEVLLIFLYLAGIILLFPLSIGIFLAYFVYPIISFFHKKCKIPHSISIILLLLIVIIFFIEIIVLSVQLVVTLTPFISDQLTTIGNSLQRFPIFNSVITEASSALQGSMLIVVNYVQASITNTIKVLLFLFTFIFSLIESRHNRLWFFSLVPKLVRDKWTNAYLAGSSILGYFIFVETVLFSVTFSILTLAFYLLHFPYFLQLALIVAIADLLPLLGLGIFFIPLAIYYAAIQKISLSLILVALYISLIIIRQLIDSKLWASSFQVRTIHSFLIGAASLLLFGLYGFLLSPFLLLLTVKLRNTSIFDKE